MDELIQISDAIKRVHGVPAVHIDSAAICQVFKGKTIWDGVVEVFELIGHPQTKRCYAWKHWEDAIGEHDRIVIMLNIPPVDSPVAAVRAAMITDNG